MTDRDALIAKLRQRASKHKRSAETAVAVGMPGSASTWLDEAAFYDACADALAALPPPATLSSFQEEARQKLRDVLARYDLLDEVHGLGRDVDEAVRWALGALADPTATDAATPPPADPLPPRPTGSEPINRADLVRYGVATPGSPTLLTPMADGYWTPWHIAAQTPADPPALVALLKDTADALWGMQMQPDCWCPPGISGEDYHTDACRDARAVSKRLLVYPLPAAPPVTEKE